MAGDTAKAEIQIQCYGMLQRVCGGTTHRVSMPVSPAFTVADVLTQFVQQHPALKRHLSYTACAVGDRFVDRHAELSAGDVLALLPPVSGG